MTSSGTTAESARSIACQIDGIDTCILNMLEKDGRATLAQLSEATGLSVSAVLSGYKAIIDDEKRGLPVSAYIAVTPTDYACESEIPGKLHDVDGIMSCDSVAGSPSYMLTVRAESPSKLEELLNVIHQTVPVSTETTIVLQRYFAK